MKVINLGADDGLPPVDWTAIASKLDAGSAPAPDAHNARTTWLITEPAVVARVAKAWADSGWPVEPDESGSRIVQRAVARAAAVGRVSDRATVGRGGTGF